MKKLAILLAFVLLLPACSSKLWKDFSIFQKEATEAVNNLTEEAVEAKNNIETRVNQVQDAADSVSTAVDAVNQATSDLKSLSEKLEGTEETEE